jgi:FkbM family methyltransferase
MVDLLKKIIKTLLRSIGFKLIRIGPPYRPNPYGKINLETLKCMNESKGILHLGAHKGTEAEVYNWFGKKVIWIEASPKIFSFLKDNLYFYSDQRAFCALLGDQDNVKKDFYISSNDSASSSIFDFSDLVKKEGFFGRKIFMKKKISLTMKKLDTILNEENISAEEYDHWEVDVQGAELLVFKGAVNALKSCKSISVEVSKIKYYDGGVLWDELLEWLQKKSFYPTAVPSENHTEILFIKK